MSRREIVVRPVECVVEIIREDCVHYGLAFSAGKRNGTILLYDGI